MSDSDFGACEEIYRLNEPGRFPEGYFPRFSDWLRKRRALILVAESEGEIRGFGGINAQVQAGRHFAALTFGLVHPAHHRAGFGTTLLLARLALLRPESERCTAMLSTVGGSETFYGRFGFDYFHSVPGDNGYAGDTYICGIAIGDPQRCLAKLQAAHMSKAVLSAVIPSFENITSAVSAPEAGLLETRPSA